MFQSYSRQALICLAKIGQCLLVFAYQWLLHNLLRTMSLSICKPLKDLTLFSKSNEFVFGSAVVCARLIYF